MTKLVLMVGLPQSGKSTAAMHLAAEHGAAIVNPDAIRQALHGQAFVPETEPLVWTLAEYMARALILTGHEMVVIDATNNTSARRLRWTRVARDFGIPAMAWVMDTDKQTCIDRAEENVRPELVPVIERMAGQHEPIDEEAEGVQDLKR